MMAESIVLLSRRDTLLQENVSVLGCFPGHDHAKRLPGIARAARQRTRPGRNESSVRRSRGLIARGYLVSGRCAPKPKCYGGVRGVDVLRIGTKPRTRKAYFSSGGALPLRFDGMHGSQRVLESTLQTNKSTATDREGCHEMPRRDRFPHGTRLSSA